MSNAQNILSKIHTLLSAAPVSFRQKVCEECNWSIPTFYRRLRQLNSQQEAFHILSSAEQRMIISIFNAVYQELSEELQQIP